MKRSNASQSALSNNTKTANSKNNGKSTKSAAAAKKQSAQQKKSKQNDSSKNNDSNKKNNSNKKQASKLWIIIAIAILGIILAIILFWSASPKPDTSNVLVRVNDVPITKTEFGFQYNLLPESYRSSFTQEQILEQIIDEELVVQAAKRNGSTVTLQEVNERVQKILASTGTSLADLQKNLDGYNITQEQFESLVQRQLLIERYLKDKIIQIPIDDAMVRAAYDASQEKYAVAEQVTVRHVLIASQQTNAAVIAKSVYDRARAGEDFCLLVTNFSNDKGSKETCGQYTFPRGFMVPEFEQASFDMKPKEVRLVQTQFGYHVIMKINNTPASIKPFETVKPLIADELQATARAKQYRDILTKLRATATIRYQNGTVIVPVQAQSIASAKDQSAKLDVVVPSTPSAPAQPIVEPVAQPVVQSPQVANEQTVGGIDALTLQKITCIASKSTLYGMPWSSDTQRAQNIFTNAGVALNYVDCEKDSALCTKQKVIAYPTWDIDGKNYPGAMTVLQLAQTASC